MAKMELILFSVGVLAIAVAAPMGSQPPNFQGTFSNFGNTNQRQAADLEGSDLLYAAYRPLFGYGVHPAAVDLAFGAGLGILPAGVVVSPVVPPLVPPVPLLLR